LLTLFTLFLSNIEYTNIYKDAKVMIPRKKTCIAFIKLLNLQSIGIPFLYKPTSPANALISQNIRAIITNLNGKPPANSYFDALE